MNKKKNRYSPSPSTGIKTRCTNRFAIDYNSDIETTCSKFLLIATSPGVARVMI